MKTVTIHEAKTHLSRLLRRVAAGEEILIARRDQPVARLVPVVEEPGSFTPGMDEGRVWIADDFDAPLNDELMNSFEAPG